METDSTGIKSAPTPAKLRLTAVITNYNYGHYLPVAVEAMVNQSRPADELILIDDASTDGSQRVVDVMAQRYPFIKVVKHEVNRGMNLSGQESLEMATGDYFYWGSADDMVLPGFFETAMSLLERYPTAPLCAGVPSHWNEESDRQFETCVGMPAEPAFLEPKVLWGMVRNGILEMSGAWSIYRVENLKTLGGIRTSLKWNFDFFSVYTLAFGGGLAWTARPTAVVRYHRRSYSRMGADRRVEQNLILVELVRLVITELPAKIQIGFRNSGAMAQLPWPIAQTLLLKPRFWSQLSFAFCRAWISRRAYRAMVVTAKVIFPSKLYRAVWQNVRTETKYDLSSMKSHKTL